MIWPSVACPDCPALPGEPCVTSSDRRSPRPHAARELEQAFRAAELRQDGVADFRTYQERRAVRAAAARAAGG